MSYVLLCPMCPIAIQWDRIQLNWTHGFFSRLTHLATCNLYPRPRALSCATASEVRTTLCTPVESTHTCSPTVAQISAFISCVEWPTFMQVPEREAREVSVERSSPAADCRSNCPGLSSVLERDQAGGSDSCRDDAALWKLVPVVRELMSLPARKLPSSPRRVSISAAACRLPTSPRSIPISARWVCAAAGRVTVARPGPRG